MNAAKSVLDTKMRDIDTVRAELEKARAEYEKTKYAYDHWNGHWTGSRALGSCLMSDGSKVADLERELANLESKND